MPITNSTIGKGTIIHQKGLVNIYDSVIGENCNIGAFTEIGKSIVKDNCHIAAHAYLCPGVVLERDVFIGPGVRFSNDKYPPTPREEWIMLLTSVLKGASIGMGAIILPGITIGEKAVIGAGAIVTSNVLPGATVRGIPARMVNVKA